MPIQDVYDLFPKTVVVGELGLENNDEIVSYLLEEFSKDKYFHEGNGFYKTDPYLHEMQLFQPMVELIMKNVRTVLFDINDYNEIIEPYIVSMWAIGNVNGSSVHRHYHPNSFLSGVYYPNEVSTGNAPLRFYTPHRNMILPSVRNSNNVKNVKGIQPKKGQFILFPSELEHDTMETIGDEIRLSIAFNIFLKGEIGEEETLTLINL